MENKKSGIRLRHLQQQPQEAIRRDLSPNNPNRKKIFDKNQRMRQNERVPADEKQRKRGRNEDEGFNQYEELVDNLKKKTMELELRDEAIKFLNKQIEDLKTSLRLKDKEIAKLNHQISILQKEQQASKTMPKQSVFDSFKNPSQIAPSFNEVNRYNNSHNQSTEIVNVKPKTGYQERSLNEQISMGNLNACKNSFDQKKDEAEILSPFMALNNTHSFSNIPSSKDRDSRIEIKTSRITNQNVSHHSPTEYSGFNKKKSNNQFDFSREDYMPKRSMIDSVNKQLQKFNIFGEPLDSKKEIFARSKLQIEDSRQFKFQEFEDKGYGDFGPNVIY